MSTAPSRRDQCLSAARSPPGTSVEKKESEIKKMMATVLKDKQKIEDTIAELDRYKRDALQKTWEKVDV